MYVPKIFENSDQRASLDLMNQHGFATIVMHTHDGLLGNHLPLLVLEDAQTIKLAGHMARANPLWQHFASCGSVLAIFHGPHGYISPSWYVDGQNVPTWNYAVVHAYGRSEVIQEPDRLTRLLEAMTEKYESTQPRPWHPRWNEDQMMDMMNGIVGFEITVERMESKFKLSQNRSSSDRAGVLEALSKREDDASQALIALMQRGEFS